MSELSLTTETRGDIEQRAARIYRDNLNASHRWTDRIFVCLMPLQWIAGILAAWLITPRTWAGSQSEPHVHIWAALLLGGAITFFPVALAILHPGKAITRYTVAIGQMLTSALLIHLTGGRIETHFHVFGSLAFLAVYRDWRVLMVATVVVAVDHFVRGVYYPQSVFGVLNAGDWRWFEHAGWVFFEDVVLLIAGRMSLAEVRAIALHRAELETTNQIIEGKVDQRTSELKRVNEALAKASEEARAASEAKSAFLANMSHEIRTPMTAILGYADLMLDPAIDASQRLNHLYTLRRNGEHLLSVLNDILDISKIEAGKMQIERIACSPAQIITEAESLMRSRAFEKKLSLRIETRGSIPEKIQTDPTRLRQILINLVSNAIKFTAAGQITVRMQMHTPADAHEPKLRVDVQDTGIGMDEAQLGLMFRPFSQADNSMTRRFGGTGLGLSISRRLAQMLGGDISVSSAAGKGSTFSVVVGTGPLAGITMLDEPRMTIEETPAGQPASKAAEKLYGRVLLAEDGPDNQRLITFFLQKMGLEVDVVDNGQLACERALSAEQTNRPYDLILMDMQMPVLDGYAAAARLRSKKYLRPIIALTAHAMIEDRGKCISAGCDDYASKPIHRDKLQKLLQKHLTSGKVTAKAA